MSPRQRRFETRACIVLGALVAIFYLWTAMQPGDSWIPATKAPQGYYPLETAGFRSGHLYTSNAPDPRLLALDDPYDPAANTPYRAHDMSLYRGRYYLYFGVTPALILFWPFAVLTGRYLTEPFAVGLLCTGAIWAGMGLLLAIRRRHFPHAPFLALLASWVCLAWATPLSLLVEGPRVYEVPISCAICLQALMLCACFRAMRSRRHPFACMSVAGLLLGLSIGARPNYIAGAVALLFPAIFVARANAGGRKGVAPAIAKALTATFLPTALFGMGLLWFNWARFGSALEFGVHFQLEAERVTGITTISLGRLVPHGALFLFNPGQWDSYFPFFYPSGGQPFGLVRYVPWIWLVPFAFLFRADGETAVRSERNAAVSTLAAAFLANLALLSCFYGTTARYPGDFANAGLIVAGVGALALTQHAALGRRTAAAGVLLVAASVVSILICMAAYAGWAPMAERLTRIARAANWPAYALQRARGRQFGGLDLELRVPTDPRGASQELFETGREAGRRDRLDISFLPGNRARLNFTHEGLPALQGDVFQIPADRKLVVEARCGSLIPPFGHPAFSGWTESAFEIAKTNLRLTVNGRNTLRSSLECYPASPASTTVVGERGAPAPIVELVRAGRLPLPRPQETLALNGGPMPVELSLLLPAGGGAGADPLLLTGKGSRSDLVYCTYDGADHVRFALDHLGAGGPQSRPVPYDPLTRHTVTLWMGSMAKGAPRRDGLGTSPERLIVAFDGRTLLNVHQEFYQDASGLASVGVNRGISSAAGTDYTGEIFGARQVDDSKLPGFANAGASYGTVEMSVDFPLRVPGTQEPLVVTGVPGAGDFVYVRYVDATHVAVAYDHWGVGGPRSEPIDVDYSMSHKISVSIPSLYPPGSLLNHAGIVRVLLDGRTALEGKCANYPCDVGQIEIATNRIGGSTCGPDFTGNILDSERSAGPWK
jgi:hypothetical protein